MIALPSDPSSRPGLTVLLLCGSIGCTDINRWDDGAWEEECFQTSNTCEWTQTITQPVTPHVYTLDASDQHSRTEVDYNDSGWPETPTSETLSRAQEYEGHFWKICDRYSDDVYFDCSQNAIHLIQPDLGIESYIEAFCGSLDNAWIRSHSSGMLIKKGEARMNHWMEITCQVFELTEDNVSWDEQREGCSMTYTSILKLK